MLQTAVRQRSTCGSKDATVAGLVGLGENQYDRNGEEIISPVVPPAHAVIQPFAMVIKVFHTLVANSAVLHSGAAEFKIKNTWVVIVN